DVLLSLGCRFSEFTTGRWRAVSSATRLVQCDVDPEEIGRVYVPEVGLLGDAGATARALTTVVAGREEPSASRRRRAAELRRRYCEESVLPPAAGAGSGVPSRAVVEALRSVLARRPATVLSDAASFGPWLHRYVGFERAGSYQGSAGGAMGWGFPAAMGVQLARPGEPVLCVSGDGAFWMVAHDLETA